MFEIFRVKKSKNLVLKNPTISGQKVKIFRVKNSKNVVLKNPKILS